MFIALVLWIVWFFHCFAFTVLFSFLESCKLMSTSHDKYRGGTGPCLTWVSISVFFSLVYVRRRYLANYWSSVINKYQRRSCSYRVTANYFFPFQPPPSPPPKKSYLKKKQTLANWQINGVSFLRCSGLGIVCATILFFVFAARPSQVYALLSPINLRTWGYLVMASNKELLPQKVRKMTLKQRLLLMWFIFCSSTIAIELPYFRNLEQCFL